MSLYQKLVAGLLLPLHEKLKGHDTIAVHNAMEKSQWLSPEQLAQLQLDNLRRFLLRIGSTVPYYEALFARLGFDPAELTSLTDLQRLPLTDKATIRAHTEDLKARGASGLKRFNTGGSSGEPLIFYLGNERVSHDVAAKRRATRWWGVDIGDPEIVVWGSPIELGAQDRVRLLRDRLFRTELLSAFEMSEANLARFVQRIRDCRPAMLFGYPSSLALIADYAREQGVPLDNLGIKVAFVTSERLYDHQRERIEQVFGCPVANGYGGRDAGFIAHACPEGSLHITAEDMVLEIVDGDGTVLPPGESGEIVVTHLFTSEFPFVRYRTGDVGVLGSEPCACGRGLPVLASVEGRATDFVTAADGTVLHGLALIYVLRDIPGVDEFRIVQESLQQTRVEVVATGAVDRSDLAQEIQRQFRQRLGAEVEVPVEYLEAIPREQSGKFRYVVSKVATR
ncbi:phenylacetate--CoA ligase family protein [Kineobactrum salinum]|uniref:Phenylacetate--CoA ligase family protein n=1 Tax=Kineobactrum salinum TaxID=2708301 RepID=A0A6C0TZC2_9GAMM|nr:AMP-binding protein [Kineobactrum salinum]QIB64719.1 phenylacetate--CoA ligase family protein [Kineobactrum salinum]